MLKTYTLTRLYTLVLPVSTSRGPQIVEFKGVQNMKMHGQYTTTDVEMQAVLERQPEYKSGVYRITARLTEDSEETPAEQKASETAAKAEVPSTSAVKTSAKKTVPRN